MFHRYKLPAEAFFGNSANQRERAAKMPVIRPKHSPVTKPEINSTGAMYSTAFPKSKKFDSAICAAVFANAPAKLTPTQLTCRFALRCNTSIAAAEANEPAAENKKIYEKRVPVIKPCPSILSSTKSKISFAPNTYKASTSGIFASPKRIKGSGLGITYSTADKKRHSEAKKAIKLRRFIVSGFCIHQPEFTVTPYKVSLFASFFNRRINRGVQRVRREFTTKKGVPKTWKDAVELRIGKQKSSFRTDNLFGSIDMMAIH